MRSLLRASAAEPLLLAGPADFQDSQLFHDQWQHEAERLRDVFRA
jgi:hypothetical protein